MKMKRQPLRGLGYILVLLVLSLTLTPFIWADYPQEKEVHISPESGPERAPRRLLNPKPVPPGTGFIPPEMDLSHLTGQRMSGVSTTLPSRFDWRSTGKVTSVKNQGSCGSCYAFASLANFESALLIAGEGSHDYSENNVKECNWYDSSCAGGNYWKMASFLSKNGTVRESCDPYVASDVSCKTICSYQKTLLDWRIISESSVPSTNVLKTYIQTHGPVYTSIYAGDNDAWETEFKGYNGSYTLHYSGSDNTNHAVLIVGWDDTLSHAGGTGAWIVKNSWGTNWGGTCGYGSERGYFTIAYGSANIGRYSSYIYDWQDYDSSGSLMYYDEGGWTDAYGYSGNTTAWGLCRFIPSENTYLTRVEFWTSDATTDVDVYIYDNFNTSTKTPSNLLHTDLNNSFTEAGYHSVVVDTPLALTTGNDIIAVVKFTNSSYGYPVVVDYQGPSETQRTYLSRLGNDGTWEDMGTAESVDVAIRLRTSGTPPTPTPTRTPGAVQMFLPLIKKGFPLPTPTPTATITPTPTPTPEWQGRPNDGIWWGVTITEGHPDDPQTIAFETAQGGSKIRAGMDLVTYVYESNFWICWGTAVWEIASAVPIRADGTFIFSRSYFDGDISAEGRFVSPTRAEGTYTTDVLYGVCGNIHNTGTWWATWQGATSESSEPMGEGKFRLEMRTR